MTEPSESAKTTAIETDTPSTEDKNIKDANAVNNVENAEKTESTTHTGRGKAIAIAAVVLILIAGVGGYAYWTHFEAAAYHDSVVTAETADTKLTKTIDKATAVTYKADQLKEPKLLDQLDNAIKKSGISKSAWFAGMAGSGGKPTRLPSLASFFAIADGLGITPEELIAAMRKEAEVREKSNGERAENDE